MSFVAHGPLVQIEAELNRTLCNKLSETKVLRVSIFYILFCTFFSSPEHAQGELLGSCDVHPTCGRL